MNRLKLFKTFINETQEKNLELSMATADHKIQKIYKRYKELLSRSKSELIKIFKQYNDSEVDISKESFENIAVFILNFEFDKKDLKEYDVFISSIKY